MICEHLREILDSRSIPEPNSGCLLWIGHVSQKGYGQFHRSGKQISAHRTAYEIFVGPIPDGLLVCHRCDTPSCINPDHLFVGTPSDNIRDMIQKGRGKGKNPRAGKSWNGARRGERNPRAKISEEQVLTIRADPRPQSVIAAEYGISQSAISRIKRRQDWSHLETANDKF